MTISNFPITWITKALDADVTRFLKRWSGLARPADSARLFLPPTSGGLNLPSVSDLYRRLQVGKACLLLTSRDGCANQVARLALGKESVNKRVAFKPFTSAQVSFSEAPGASRKTTVACAKLAETRLQTENRLKHSVALNVQGQLFRLVDEIASTAWSKATQLLSSPLFKFALNAAQDTLPHNANLALWRKNQSLSDRCRLCGDRQTLGHILNSCRVALQARRFNNRHDQVLEIITTFVSDHIPENYKVVSDLRQDQPYVFPSALAHTDLRPDLVVFCEEDKQAIIIELTVCLEAAFQSAKDRKEAKYLELLEEVESNSYNADLITLEVGSRGFVHSGGFMELKESLAIRRKDILSLLPLVAAAAIKGSYEIWTSRNTPPAN